MQSGVTEVLGRLCSPLSQIGNSASCNKPASAALVSETEEKSSEEAVLRTLVAATPNNGVVTLDAVMPDRGSGHSVLPSSRWESWLLRPETLAARVWQILM